MRQDRNTGRPKLQILSTCKNLIKELQSLPLSRSNSEDVDTHSADHAYDAFTLYVNEQMKLDHPYDRMLKIKTDIYEPSDGIWILIMAENDNTFLNANNLYEDVEGEAGKNIKLEDDQRMYLVGIIQNRLESC